MVVNYGNVIDSVQGWKVVEKERDAQGCQDTDCQWLIYNPKGLRAGDRVKITFEKVELNGRKPNKRSR